MFVDSFTEMIVFNIHKILGGFGIAFVWLLFSYLLHSKTVDSVDLLIAKLNAIDISNRKEK